ncbi:cob(I)yrinic acid a,c-diamide adenosyltransferase [Rhizobium sp. Root1220]|uniref:cob(I)yrinic acid a,c-diamide adenosyltransferase n=1 Tax=Rhizobium sp. Root1220 TaxID=1736432 RepID=UPI0006FAB14B|nr:cob(I)yrinic acid a,c-diamide adenosyltransferase [Rhizobium sp. Root1220]KQV73325.1 cob(I)yrinic acid a c-diamide adenosyltransferase [Rhizobium sp. Root1220]
MVKLNKIYTKTGDDGTTGLVSGPRRVKDDLRVEAFGTIDEANSAIGIARLHMQGMPELDGMLMRIQNDLFDLGADLATPDTGKPPEYEPLRIVDTQVTRIEHDIDTLNGDLQPLTSFVLPGGHTAAAHLHLARTIARRAERLMVSLARTKGEVVSQAALKYVNRLSDFLFVAARHANDRGHADVLWVPGKNR